MTSYRRIRMPGATYFPTVSLAGRSSDLLVREVAHLRAAVVVTQRERPFWRDAFVVSPDHLQRFEPCRQEMPIIPQGGG